jgi:ribonuclease III
LLPVISTIRGVIRAIRRTLPRPAHSESGHSQVAAVPLEHFIGYASSDPQLFDLALRHRSILRGSDDGHLLSNERLEFLGDAVLGLLTAEYLYSLFPDRNEGFLTRLRAKIVNGPTLALHAGQQGLGELILMSENMALSDGRSNMTILSDAFEAVIGAIYTEKGLDEARIFVHKRLLSRLDLPSLANQEDNYKSLLLEHCQGLGMPQPVYRVASESGPSHARTFVIEVFVGDRILGEGTAPSKKKAEQEAARKALGMIAG